MLYNLPIVTTVSVVVPFLPFRILNIDLGKPRKGTTMETTGRVPTSRVGIL